MKIIVAILMAFSIGFLQRMPACGEDLRKREIQKKARPPIGVADRAFEFKSGDVLLSHTATV